MGNRRKRLKNFLFVFAAVVSIFVFFASCVITFLEVYSYRDSREETANVSAVSSAAASPSSSPPSGKVSSAAAGTAVTDENLLLVNYDHKLPDGYQPDLISVYGVQINRRAAAAYEKMNAAAASAGVSLWISSAYRSSEKQEELFQEEIDGYSKSYSSVGEAEAYAEKSVARPGYSEHATGLAMDLNGVRDDFDTTPAFQWLSEHAQDYGFVLRYPKDKQEITKIKYEPWHYRYVGVENAQVMKKKNLCLEEYLDFLQK
ncbi:D-alanyl-D-alanine carboxypeptidase family protein [Caproiciproducens sp. NJN-50]|uniref:M15 family metallopeptidase n=1 Tax=Acutalibacteraceae TaxID=3082771 RepID=UPI000FFE0835|nr:MULTISPECIES: M15 family metallopeptidase [Acutalibacteraceae]QAT49500.1 D-alanyl-D-alanine carboxypeptidase family protein [Caproiciproducens sp. NJN-50]